ncbi:MAG: TetR/AcrR family transcriptional regulator [Eubacteriales bacterium]
MEEIISKQQLKSKATKDKIFKAAKEILKKDGYEALSIKNICESAGVSNGSFYHHFQTKEDLLSYYIEHLPSMNAHMLDIPTSLEETIESIIQVYLNYVDYCNDLGVEFLSNYYVPKNEALNPQVRTERAYPIITVQHYLEKALAQNIISTDLTLDEITTDIRMLIIGNVFEWCIHNGETDFAGNVRRSFATYLKTALH